MHDLGGRVAVVTGAAQRIGLTIAQTLAQAGAAVVIGDVVDGEAAAAEIRSAGGQALYRRADVSHAEDMAALAAAATDAYGRLDIWVNNAKVDARESVTDLALEDWNAVLSVCLTGAFLGAKYAIPAMIASGGGAIVNIASVAGLRGAPVEVMNTVVYHATKGGLIALTRDLAWKWARHRIRVNAIAPGWFPSEMSRLILERGGDTILGTIPLGRYGGDDDLKGAVALLASRASEFMTGQVVVVDGGQSA